MPVANPPAALILRCPKCWYPTTTVTLGGFLVVSRCDNCWWYYAIADSRETARARG